MPAPYAICIERDLSISFLPKSATAEAAKLTLHLPVVGVAEEQQAVLLKCSFLTNSLFEDFSIKNAKKQDLYFIEDGRTPANQCWNPGDAISASNNYLATGSFCQHCHTELRAEFILTVWKITLEGNCHACV